MGLSMLKARYDKQLLEGRQDFCLIIHKVLHVLEIHEIYQGMNCLLDFIHFLSVAVKVPEVL